VDWRAFIAWEQQMTTAARVTVAATPIAMLCGFPFDRVRMIRSDAEKQIIPADNADMMMSSPPLVKIIAAAQDIKKQANPATAAFLTTEGTPFSHPCISFESIGDKVEFTSAAGVSGKPAGDGFGEPHCSSSLMIFPPRL
jgi:hypothetical protein